MLQITEPTQRITIHFECFDEVPEGKYVAWIDGEDYKGMVVSGDSIGECMEELGVSLKVLELYRKNLMQKKK